MDRNLVMRVQSGDEDAFEALVTGDHARLFRVAQGILGDRHLAEDATQQAYLEVWRHIGDLKDVERFDGWSYRLLVRICYAEGRRKADWLPESAITPKDEPHIGDISGIVVDRHQLALDGTGTAD